MNLLYLGGTVAVFVYALRWGVLWATGLALIWPAWLGYHGVLALLTWMAP